MKKILIVDDDDDFLEWVMTGLAQESFELVSATTGKRALSLVRSAKPDLILLDIRLPDIDGFDVLRHIRETGASAAIPVVLITGVFREIELKEKGYQLGADDFLVKPFSYEQLRARINRLLER